MKERELWQLCEPLAFPAVHPLVTIVSLGVCYILPVD